MNREIIEIYGKKTEVVYNNDGSIVFAKQTLTHQGYHAEDDMTTISGYGVVTDIIKDIGFTHLEDHEIPQGAIVDFQYVEGNPENEFSHAQLGTLKVYDKDGNLVAGESFRPGGFTSIVFDGQLVEDPNGIAMSAPITVKQVVGKNISEIKTAGISL